MLPYVIDFETEGIADWPDYPPKPVGVSIWYPEAEAPTYMAWGHPSENNCTYEDARRALSEVWGHETLFHYARFDTEVARVHMGLPYPKDHLRVHDTLFLNYLYDVHAPTLSLKPSAQRILNIPPDEKDELDAWLVAHGHKPGRDICKAPGDLVGRYANGDTYRTRRLFEHLMDHVNKAGMLAAYRREQKLSPILAKSEAEGLRINRVKLVMDLIDAERAFTEAGNRLLSVIGSCNLDSSAELAQALLKSGRAKEDDFLRTPTGKLSTAKASMDQAVKDPELRQLLQYRGNLKTILTTFMRPWAVMSGYDGRLRPQWNQVKGEEYGTRTGRLSSNNPNFQNVPTEFKVKPPAGLPALPMLRQYVLPDEGHVLVKSDFNGQEMRIAAHFAEGRAAEIYRDDPRADFHAVVSDIIRRDTGMVLDRKMVKITGFSLIYGSGVNSLSELLGVPRSTAAVVRAHYFNALPGFQDLMNDVSARGRSGAPVKTWGGRLIYAEPPKMVKGQQWSFEYKLLNYLIQGSAADQTKEAINELGYKTPHRRFLATVHDENVYSVDPEHVEEEVAAIRASMEAQSGWDVPFRAEVQVGENWHDMTPFEARGDLAATSKTDSNSPNRAVDSSTQLPA
jgi:DNA polymerase I-like protein with 3'-5' exonuclease and polymerase domains